MKRQRRDAEASSFDEGVALAMELGLMHKDILAMVTEVFTPDRLTTDERRFLAGPLVVHESAWNDTRPRWLADHAFADRSRIVFGHMPGHIVGPAELVAVMYGASMQHPFGNKLTDLYCWATVNAVAKWKKITVASCWLKHGHEPIPDGWVFEERGRLHDLYRRLATEIRRKVVSAQAQRERGERGEAKEQRREGGAAERPVIATQFSLF